MGDGSETIQLAVCLSLNRRSSFASREEERKEPTFERSIRQGQV